MSHTSHGNRVHIRASQCTGKARFDSPHQAQAVLRRGRAKKPAGKRRPDKHRQMYRCAHCGGWHLGGSA